MTTKGTPDLEQRWSGGPFRHLKPDASGLCHFCGINDWRGDVCQSCGRCRQCLGVASDFWSAGVFMARCACEVRPSSCAVELPKHLTGRLQTFAALVKVNNGAEELAEALESDQPTPLDDADLCEVANYFTASDARQALQGKDGDDIREMVSQRFNELPLSVETFRMVKVLLSTGGPADWLEYTVDDTDNEPEIVAVEYVFQDWFDGARQRLEDEDLDTAKEAAEIAGWAEKYE